LAGCVACFALPITSEKRPVIISLPNHFRAFARIFESLGIAWQGAQKGPNSKASSPQSDGEALQRRGQANIAFGVT